jgi:hypothetical protein
MKLNPETFHPAFPHVPFTDQFNQTHLVFGINKLEYLAGLIAPGFQAAMPTALPDVVADQSVQIALAIMEKCSELYKQLADEKNSPKVVSLSK